ncbi:TetR/AcrR family transcriptional regulator [Microvirga guangxiensis]|uniref:Transcriptional regulator, TetR family n=1 Tax=Microvirga guangxiensis TaxID=549386 RepID=A0A1G5LHZ8_9HYPH|nr:TetR/AcrR family transcriptional regulator [Microvirga guangxiensis]SCZ12426.1 transcriptional regulator, TetR family [Microvirga guangxiensis]
MARPKTIPDEQVLDTLLGALMESGPDGLTFTIASNACGLSPATLVQRYGAREAMVEVILLRAWDRLDAETEAADAEEALTPEGAINLLLRLMPPETAERDASNGLLLLREDMRNPVLRRRGAAWGHRLAAALGGRLSRDPAKGKRLGWQMASLWQGAHTWWAFTREEPPGQAIRRVLEEWVADIRRMRNGDQTHG